MREIIQFYQSPYKIEGRTEQIPFSSNRPRYIHEGMPVTNFRYDIVCATDDDICLMYGIPHTNSSCFFVICDDFMHRGIGMKAHAEFFSQRRHGIDNLDHSAFGVPSSQAKIGIVHKIVKGWRLLGFRSEKEDWKLKD